MMSSHNTSSSIQGELAQHMNVGDPNTSAQTNYRRRARLALYFNKLSEQVGACSHLKSNTVTTSSLSF